MQGMKSLHEVALEWNVSTRTVRNWIAKGPIVAYKRNNHVILIDERSLDGILKPVRGAR